jgi:para-nitrobenzyl esterase
MFRDWVQKSYAPVADEVFPMYMIPTPADAREAFIRAETDLEMIAPARWTAQAMQGMKSNVYLYEVTWAFPSQGGQQLGAFHGMDPWLMFDSPPVPRDATGDVLAEALRDYWIQFARTGDPNIQGLPKWPPYDAATASYLELGAKIRPAARLHQDAFALVERLYTTRLTSIRP